MTETRQLKVLILGASGHTGTHLVKQALDRGYQVTAFVRPGKHTTFAEPRLRIFEGDARSLTDMTTALKKQDAVISALGSNKLRDTLMAESTRVLIDAADATGVKRIIMLSSFLANPSPLRPVFKLPKLFMKGMLNDKSIAEDLLRSSNLDWTIVCATALDRAKPGRTVRVLQDSKQIGLSSGIARADVATYMLDVLSEQRFIRSSVIISTK